MRRLSLFFGNPLTCPVESLGWTVILAIIGFFWFATGLITYFTGVE